MLSSILRTALFFNTSNLVKFSIRRAFILIVLLSFNCSVFGQNDDISIDPELWEILEEKASNIEWNSSIEEIKLLIKGKCLDDKDCLYNAYNKCQKYFEAKFQLNHSISLCHEMVTIGQETKNLNYEGLARSELSRYYDALGEFKLGLEHGQKASKCFEESGNLNRLYLTQYYHLESSLAFTNPNEVLSEMDKLYAKVVEHNDTTLLTKFNIRLLNVKSGHKPSDVNFHLRNLEEIAESIGKEEITDHIYLVTNQRHGDQAMNQQNWDSAIYYYKEAVKYCISGSSKWQEVYCTQKLSRAYLAKGDLDSALANLEIAEKRGKSIQVFNLLAENYKLKHQIYEDLGQYDLAYENIVKRYEYQNLFDKRGEGFSPEKFYLEREKDALASVNENQKLHMELQKSRMSYLTALVVFAFLTGLFFVFGFRREQKRKKELFEQNEFIKSQSERLEKLDKAKSRFFANVSHELRTPLTLILGPTKSLASDNTLNQDQKKLVGMVDEASKQLDHLVGDILDLSNLELGKLELTKTEVRIGEYLKSYFNQFEEIARIKKIDYSIEVNIDENLFGHIDVVKTKQLINNILSNAFKYTPTGGNVIVNAIVYNSQLEINISDTGCGIPEEDIPHLFERYFQTNNESNPAEGGFGIGLALCKELIDVMKGKITVDSDIGLGSNFHLEWPIEVYQNKVVKENEKQGYQIQEEEFLVDKVYPKKLKRKQNDIAHHLLIVEDNIKLFEFMYHILKGKYQIHHAENGQKAFDLISENSFDLIISDIMMPVMDGYSLLEKLKNDKEYSSIPVVMVTARADTNDKIKALKMGVDDYIIKPFQESELIRSVDKLLKNKAIRTNEMLNAGEEIGETISAKDLDWLSHLEEFVDKNLSNSQMNVNFIASSLAISDSSLLRKTKRVVGMTPLSYITERRLQAARKYLELNQYNTIQEIALAVGYMDARTLSRNFKSRFGKLPSNYLDETIVTSN